LKFIPQLKALSLNSSSEDTDQNKTDFKNIFQKLQMLSTKYTSIEEKFQQLVSRLELIENNASKNQLEMEKESTKLKNQIQKVDALQKQNLKFKENIDSLYEQVEEIVSTLINESK